MNTKIVVIGSGSQFTEFFLQELYKFEEFKGVTLDLVDRRPKRLEQAVRLAESLNEAVDWGVEVLGHTERKEALEQLLEMDDRDPSERAADPVEREFMVPAGNIDMTLAGINHLQWLLDIRDTKTGKDLYPEVRKRVRDPKKVPEGYRFSSKVCELFDYFPSPADNHVVDYIWCVEREIYKDLSLAPYPVDQWFGGRDADAWKEIADSITDADAARDFIRQRRVGWMNLTIARYMLTGTQKYFPALNMLNNGVIPNLDDDIVVEVPALIGPDGFKASAVGPLPDQVAPICALHGKITNFAADAAALGSKQLALEALLLDPFVHNLKRAQAYLDDILAYCKKYETRF